MSDLDLLPEMWGEIRVRLAQPADRARLRVVCRALYHADRRYQPLQEWTRKLGARFRRQIVAQGLLAWASWCPAPYYMSTDRKKLLFLRDTNTSQGLELGFDQDDTVRDFVQCQYAKEHIFWYNTSGSLGHSAVIVNLYFETFLLKRLCYSSPSATKASNSSANVAGTSVCRIIFLFDIIKIVPLVGGIVPGTHHLGEGQAMGEGDAHAFEHSPLLLSATAAFGLPFRGCRGFFIARTFGGLGLLAHCGERESKLSAPLDGGQGLFYYPVWAQ